MKIFKIFIFKLKFRLYLKNYLKIMRSRNKIKNNLSELKFKLSEINFNCDKYFTNKIFKNLPINLSIFFSQYVIFKIIRPEKINFFFLKSNKLNYPLTLEQIKLLKEEGFIINNFISSILFFLFAIYDFLKGLFIFLSVNFKFFINLKKDKKNKEHIFIRNLTEEQINSFSKNSNNIENWLKEKFDLKNYYLVHDNPKCKNKFIYNRFFLPELNKFSEIVKFNFNFFKSLFFVLLDLIFFRVKQIFIFSEIVKLNSALSKEKEYFKNSYFFFNGPAFFRPLFSYSLGKNVFYIEYSLNQNFIYFKGEKKVNQYNWKNLTWSNYILWNFEQESFFKKNQTIDAQYYVFGPVSFGVSESIELQKNYKNSILVFDSIPFRKSFSSTYNTYAPNYFDDNVIKFLEDISKLSDKYSLYIKLKRSNLNKLYSKKYKNYLNKNKKFNILKYEYSPQDIVNKFDKVICIPFSSTAYIAKLMDKKVCYYDVVGIHEDFKKTIKDIPIINNFSDLQKWSNYEK